MLFAYLSETTGAAGLDLRLKGKPPVETGANPELLALGLDLLGQGSGP